MSALAGTEAFEKLEAQRREKRKEAIVASVREVMDAGDEDNPAPRNLAELRSALAKNNAPFGLPDGDYSAELYLEQHGFAVTPTMIVERDKWDDILAEALEEGGDILPATDDGSFESSSIKADDEDADAVESASEDTAAPTTRAKKKNSTRRSRHADAEAEE